MKSITTRRNNAGFSIVELLSVLAAMSVIVALAVPALNGNQRARDVSTAAYTLAGTLEHARSFAMANNTYVFVGVTGQGSGAGATSELIVAAMSSKDGTRDFGTGNANLSPISPLLRIRNIRLEDTLPNAGGLSRPSVQAGFRMGNAASDTAGSFAWPSTAGQPQITFTRVIQFNPRGTPGIPSDIAAIPQYMEVSLAASQGDALKNCAALILDGITGSVRIYRP